MTMKMSKPLPLKIIEREFPKLVQKIEENGFVREPIKFSELEKICSELGLKCENSSFEQEPNYSDRSDSLSPSPKEKHSLVIYAENGTKKISFKLRGPSTNSNEWKFGLHDELVSVNIRSLEPVDPIDNELFWQELKADFREILETTLKTIRRVFPHTDPICNEDGQTLIISDSKSTERIIGLDYHDVIRNPQLLVKSYGDYFDRQTKG